MKAQITLTPAESKRLIAKAVARHEKVRRAMKDGIVAIGLGSTNAFIVEELLGRKIAKEKYIAGMIDPKGTCVVPSNKRLKEVVIEKGKVTGKGTADAVHRMGKDDVFIKGANAIDFEGNAGVMMASLTAGTVGHVYGIIKAKGVNLLIPAGLEKLIPYPIPELSEKLGIYEIDKSNGIQVGMMPIFGELITEVEAFEILSGATAYPIGAGGIGGAEGSYTFLIEGSKSNVEKAFKIAESIKGEKSTKALRMPCKTCEYKHCPWNGLKKTPY